MRKPEPTIGGKTFQQAHGLSDKQWSVLQAATTYSFSQVLAGGSGFGGKSYCARAMAVYGCWVLAMMGVKSPRWILARNTFPDLKDNHSASLDEEWGDWGRVVSNDKIYGYCFKFWDPALGVILLRNLDGAANSKGSKGKDKKGARAHGACIDELTETSEAMYAKLLYQCTAPGPFNSIVAFSNPDGPYYQWVMKAWHAKERRPDWWLEKDSMMKYIPFKPSDNPIWPEAKDAFMASIARLPEAVRQGRLNGVWGAPEGARWPWLDEDLHRFKMSDLKEGIPPHWLKGLGIDYGMANPFAGLWLAVDPEGKRILVYRERYGSRVPTETQAMSLRSALEEGEVLNWAKGDPAMWQRMTTPDGRVSATPAEVYQGQWEGEKKLACGFEKGVQIADRTFVMTLMDELTRIREDGKPILMIEEGCTNLWDELTAAVYADKDKMRKVGDIDPRNADHAITALFYGCPQWLMEKILEKPKEPENPWQKAMEKRMKKAGQRLERGAA